MARRIALVCALLACAVALRLRYETAVSEITGAASTCSARFDSDCDTVQSSPYAALFGVSVSIWAAAGSALLASLLLLAPRFGGGMRSAGAFLAVTNGIVSLAYLTISVAVIGANCLYCNVIQGASVAAAACLAPEAARAVRTGVDRRSLGAAAIAGALALGFALLGDAYADARVDAGRLEADMGGEGMRVDLDDALLLGDPERGAENSYLIYFDFRCPKCLGCFQTAQVMLRDHPDRAHFFFKHWPLDRECNPELFATRHENSCRAARAAMILHREGRSSEALHELFELDGRFTNKRLRELGEKYGVGGKEWTERIESRDVRDAVKRHVKEGNALDFAGVPNIYRNGRRERELRLPRR